MSSREKPNRVMLHVESNNLAPESNADRLAKSIVDLVKNSVKDHCLVSMSVLYLEIVILTLKLQRLVIFLEDVLKCWYSSYRQFLVYQP